MRVLALLAALLALLAAHPAGAEETIERYLQTVEVHPDDTLLVTEEITVTAEGREIRRGIYRDFPTVFVDDAGVRRQVGFKVVDVRRDGAEEPWHSERNGDGVRIYIGDKDVYLSPGVYTYRLTYETSRQIRRFADHDELYWNVTGNDWIFPIRAVEARVVLPQGADAQRTEAFTGRYGSTGRDVRMDREGGALVFRTTRPLEAGEGLTIVVGLAKGVVAEPTGADLLYYRYLENQSAILSGVGLLLVLVYYAVAWNRVGRDPPKGPIVPQWDPPDGISAPLAQYVHERGLTGGGWTALSAGWVALATKGLVSLDTSGKDLSIERTKTTHPAMLPRSERTLLDWLTGRGGTAVVNRSIGPSVQSLNGIFRKAVYGESRETFFNNNRVWAGVGIALSVAAIAVAVYSSATGPEDIGTIMPIVFAGFFGMVAVNSLLNAVRAREWSTRIGGALMAVVGFVVAIVTVGGTLLMSFIQDGVPAFAMVAVALALVNVVFYHLLSAPTVNGRKLMDRIEGLILYMTVAEEKRLNMPGLPAVTPSRYETLLPYAVALGIEEPWTEALNAELARAAAAGAAIAYEPSWYHGRGGSFGSSIGSSLGSMSRSFQSSVPPPKSSSSGFSGGRSGGGGGGGGGGGW